MPLLSPSAPLCFSQLNNSLTTFSCNSFTPFLHRTVPICKARHIGGVYFRTESNVLHKYVSKCKESGRDLYTEEGTASFDWGDEEEEEEEEIDEDEGLPWEGAVIYKRNASILHLEYCTTLERLGLGNLSTDVSKNKASVMGLRITKAVKDFPNGTPVQISIDVTRKKKKLRLDGIIKTVLTLVCNRCCMPSAESIFSEFSLLLTEEPPVNEPETMDFGVIFGEDKIPTLGKSGDDDEDALIDLDDQLYFPPEEKQIDISKNIRDRVHLEITMNSVCDSGCTYRHHRKKSYQVENSSMFTFTTLSSVSKTIPTSSPYHTHKTTSNYTKKSHNRFIFFKQPRRTCLLHSTVCVSPSFTNTTHSVTQNQNAKINKFCEMGDLRNAIELLTKSKSYELGLNSYCSVLQLCAEKKSLEDGKRVHSVIISNGISIDEALGAKLVFMYVNCGDLVQGRKIFDKIMNDKVFLWNLLMSEYAKIGNFRESVSLFKKMQKLGVVGNCYTFTCVLKCFAALGKVKECKRVHGYVLKLGFGSNTAVVNSLIAAYFKFGGVESAHNLFDELSEPDVVSWNSMINGCVVNGFSGNGLEIFIQMLILGVEVDLTTLVSVLVACANIGNLSLGRALHGFGVKACFSEEVVFSNTLLDMYSKCGNLNGATEVFVKMGDTTIVSWTSIIAAYVREGLYSDAIGLFDEMQSKGVRPDIYTVTSIVHACACSSSLDKGRDVHSYVIKNGMGSNLPVTNALINMYAKCGSVEEARLVFSKIPVKDIVSWNTMIGGYSQNSLPNEALELFLDMQKQFKPDDITMACVLPACAGLAALDKGREIHGHILRRGYFSDLHVGCALVDMYAKCGLLVLAQLLFDMIPKKDLISWTVMIAGYGMHGFGNEAISTFNEMRIAGIEPDESSFSVILNACSHSGLLNEGWKFFNSMRNECGVEPKLEHYACVVDLLARMGNLSKAYKFIESMPIKPDTTIWGVLLSGCRIHHDVKLAEKVAEHIFELEPDNTRYYVVLANVYAEAEKWEEVKKLRKRMQKRGFKQNPGCSWIEVGGKFNIFVAGNSKHPQAKRIDVLLRKLTMQMQNEDYFSMFRYVLINEDDMEKEMIQCGHSEKSAMAFGILNLPPGRTVRVSKNRRVCGDCHEMGKFMSKTTKREIVLRDSNRFHHFKDGLCSCRGFWFGIEWKELVLELWIREQVKVVVKCWIMLIKGLIRI